MNVKKILISLAVVFFSIASDSYAQSYILYPNDTIVVSGILDDLQTLIIQQNNQTNQTIVLKWKKIDDTVPDKWEASVCDNSFCYTDLKDSGTMNPVLPNEYGFILLHLTPHVNYGQSIIRYSVWDEKSPANIDTLTFILNVYESSAIQLKKDENSIQCFYNTLSSTIEINSENFIGCHYSVIDMTGKSILIGPIVEKYTFLHTKDLLGGIYCIKITNSKQKSYIQKIIIQN